MTSEPAMEGRIDRDEQGRALHVFPVKVYWEDTDAGGIVYYANYLKFTERARTDLLRGLGINQQSLMMDEGVNFVVRDCRIEYLKPARMDDVLSVQTRLLDMKGATMRMEQGVYREDEVLVKSEVRVACIHRSGKPARFLPQIKDKFATVV